MEGVSYEDLQFGFIYCNGELFAVACFYEEQCIRYIMDEKVLNDNIGVHQIPEYLYEVIAGCSLSSWNFFRSITENAFLKFSEVKKMELEQLKLECGPIIPKIRIAMLQEGNL